jgi:hypothetical protein
VRTGGLLVADAFKIVAQSNTGTAEPDQPQVVIN